MAATAGMDFDSYQTKLALVNTYIGAANWTGAFTALAQASVILLGLPQEVITAQQTTRFRLLKEVEQAKALIALAQSGGGTALGLLEFRRSQ